MRRRTVSLSLPALALGLASHGTGAQPAPAPVPGASDARADRPVAFDRLGKTIEADYPDVDSVVVVRKGRVLFDHYRSAPDALRDVQSVTKSVLSLAVGAALGRGVLSLDRAIGEVLGIAEQDAASSSARQVTIRDLLTMTAGYRTQERFAPGTADDPVHLLRRERVAAPGAVFTYDNLSANLLSIALEAAVGRPTATFADEALFRPLGISAYAWQAGAHGHALGFSGLRLRTRDMARLGELALNAGTWADAQLVPHAYARAAVTAQNAGGPPVGLAYGYLWWVAPGTDDRRTFLASGFGGQLIWVHPPLDLVIATTGTASAESNRRGQALALIRAELVRAAAATPP